MTAAPVLPDPMLPDIVTWAIPGFVLLMLAEIWWQRRRSRHAYHPRDTLTSLMLGLTSTIAGALTGGLVIAMAVALHRYRLFEIGWTWWAFPLAFILDDLAYYAFHRSAHRVRWFWASHIIHHSSQHYNLSTALRQSWSGFFAASFLFRWPLFLIGFPPEMVLFVAGLNLVYQFWIHTEVIGRMPRWFEAVMNTPAHHRVHHATNAAYLDANYAGVFIIWDRLFGTFVAEDPANPPRYGLVHNLGSFSIPWAMVHEFVGIARDVRAAPWRHKLSYMFREPGWSHDGSRMTSAAIKAQARTPRHTEAAPAE